MRLSAEEWRRVDWSKSNPEIAESTGASVWTVIEWRRRLRAGPGARKKRKDRGLSQPHSVEQGRRNQPAATAGAKTSPLAGKSADNVHAVDWKLVGPDDTVYQVRNLYQFVRDNPGLFAAADVEWKRRGGTRGTGGEYCNATAGILNIKGGKAKTWKGWRLL